MDQFSMRAIGYIRSSFTETSQIPKGPGAKHTEEGVLEVAPELEAGLQDAVAPIVRANLLPESLQERR